MSLDLEEATLLRAVVADPDADTPRLAYADWLNSHGRPERAQLIRLQCGAESLRVRLEAMRAQEEAIIEAHGQEWGAPLRGLGVDSWKFHRGFPEELTVRFQWFMNEHQAMNDFTPISKLHINESLTGDLDADLAQFAALPVTSQLRDLELGYPNPHPSDPSYSASGVRSLAASPYLTGLRRLALYSQRIGLSGVGIIADSANFSNLTNLTLTDPACAATPCVLRLAKSRLLPLLDKCRLGQHDISLQYLRSFPDRADGRGEQGRNR